jgi:hypothetical protein
MVFRKRDYLKLRVMGLALHDQQLGCQRPYKARCDKNIVRLDTLKIDWLGKNSKHIYIKFNLIMRDR